MAASIFSAVGARMAQPDPNAVLAICQCLYAYREPLSTAALNRIIFHDLADVNRLDATLVALATTDHLLTRQGQLWNLTDDGVEVALGRMLYLPERRPARQPDPDYSQRLAVFQELLHIEHWLRQQAELATGDSKLAARLDRGADQVEQAANRIKECLEVGK